MTTTKEQTMDEVTNGHIDREHYGPIGDAARNIASYCECSARQHVYLAAFNALSARETMIRQLGENAAKAAYEYAENMAELRATIAQQGEELARLREASLFDGETRQEIARQMDEGAGFWRHCSGCIGTDNPRSALFRCDVGMGCRECGGLGVIWDDTDYDAMARAALESPKP